MFFCFCFRNQSNSGGQSSRGEDSTMTAASLIDAIITHQINQSSSETGSQNSQSQGPPTRPGDRLFQVTKKIIKSKYFSLHLF